MPISTTPDTTGTTHKPPGLPLISALYISQYVGIGFLYFGVASILRAEGIDLESIGAVRLLGLLWIVKVLWAPLVDAFSPPGAGHYRSWLLVLQPLTALSLLALIPFGNVADNLTPLLIVMAVFITLSATQDIATDAIVTRYVPDDKQGAANATASAGQWIGNVLGGGAALLLYDLAGWAPAIIALTILAALPVLFVLRFAEPRVETAESSSVRTRYKQLGGALSGKRQRIWLTVVTPTFWACGVGVYPLVQTALVDHGWSLSSIALLMGVTTALPGIIGPVLCARAIDAWGTARAALWSGGAAAVTTLALIPVLMGSTDTLVTSILVCLYVAAMASVSTIVYRVHVSLSRAEFAGGDFTALTSAGIAATSIVGFLSYYLAASSYALAAVVLAIGAAAGAVLAFRFINRPMKESA